MSSSQQQQLELKAGKAVASGALLAGPLAKRSEWLHTWNKRFCVLTTEELAWHRDTGMSGADGIAAAGESRVLALPRQLHFQRGFPLAVVRWARPRPRAGVQSPAILSLLLAAARVHLDSPEAHPTRPDHRLALLRQVDPVSPRSPQAPAFDLIDLIDEDGFRGID